MTSEQPSRAESGSAVGQNSPFKDVCRARDEMSSAGNYLSDAIGELVEGDLPVTEEQAEKRLNAVDRHLRNAETGIRRARRRLGLDEDGDRDE